FETGCSGMCLLVCVSVCVCECVLVWSYVSRKCESVTILGCTVCVCVYEYNGTWHSGDNGSIFRLNAVVCVCVCMCVCVCVCESAGEPCVERGERSGCA